MLGNPLCWALLTALLQSSPQSPPQSPVSAKRDHHGPADIEAYIAAMEDPRRDAYQLPERVIAALRLRPTDVVADVGAGPGYFARRFARVLTDGLVYAVDVEPAMLDRLNRRLKEDGAANVIPVLAPPDDPRLPPRGVDLIFLADTWHHLDARPRYLARLRAALRPGGRLALVELHKRPLPFGPPPEKKVAREDAIAEIAAAGFKRAAEWTFLPHQYFVIFERTNEPASMTSLGAARRDGFASLLAPRAGSSAAPRPSRRATPRSGSPRGRRRA